MTDHITVANSAIPEQVISTARALCLVLAGYLAGRGWISADLGSALVAFGFAIIPWAYNQWKIRSRNKVLKKVECGDAVLVRK